MKLPNLLSPTHMPKLLTLLILLGSLATLRAAETNVVNKAQAKPQPAKASERGTPTKTCITGSLIPRKVTEQHYTAALSSPVYVISQDDIERSGA